MNCLARGKKRGSSSRILNLSNGSDVEIARSLRAKLVDRDGEIIWAEGDLYRFVGTHWAPYKSHMLRRDAHAFDGAAYGERAKVKLSKSRLDSILHELNAMAAEPDHFLSSQSGVNCANGFIGFDADGRPKLKAHARDDRARHALPAAWCPECDWRESPLLGALLRGCFLNDQDQAQRIDLVGEILGAAALGCATTLAQPRAFIFFGPTANNGKSQVVDCIRGILPQEAVTSIPPAKFGDERMLAALAGAQLNTAGELGSTEAIASDAFKSVVTGDAVTARPVYRAPFEFRPRALHVFATNALPPVQGAFDRGMRRRLLLLPFNRSFSTKEMIPNLAARIVAEEAGALLAFAVEGAGRLLRNGSYTEPPSCFEALNEWARSADPVIAWMEDRTEYAPDHRTLVRELDLDFRKWARGERLTERALPAVNNFCRRILALDGRLTRQKANASRYIVGLRLCGS